MTQRWPFEDEPHLAVITLRRIMSGERPVLYALHTHDGEWQFLDGEDVTEEDAIVAGLGEMVEFDAAIRELAALPHGFCAFREQAERPWVVQYTGDPEDEGS